MASRGVDRPNRGLWKLPCDAASPGFARLVGSEGGDEIVDHVDGPVGVTALGEEPSHVCNVVS